MVDIEFMVQYAVLAWASGTPELAHWSDNVRILEVLGKEGLFSEAEAAALTRAYLDYRSAAHQLALQQQPGEVAGSQFAQERALVTAQWERLLGDASAELFER